MEKKCNKCEIVKSIDEFTKRKDSKDGKTSRCKICAKEYRIKNKETLKDYQKKHQKKYAQQRKETNKKWRENNRERIKEKNKKYRKNNLGYHKKYAEDNKERYKKARRIRHLNDTLYKLSSNIRSAIYFSLKAKGYSKKTRTYNIIKCEYDILMQWLNEIASNGHTFGIGDLHIDHVVPISLAETEEEILLLNHYSNFQLLTADENMSKGNRYVNPVNLARVLEHHPYPDKIREIHARL